MDTNRSHIREDLPFLEYYILNRESERLVKRAEEISLKFKDGMTTEKDSKEAIEIVEKTEVIWRKSTGVLNRMIKYELTTKN